MSSIVYIHYEDSRQRRQKTYPLHDLVVGCVLDELGAGDHAVESEWELRKRVQPIPCNGVGGVLNRMRKVPAGRWAFFALLDQDRLYSALNRPASACRALLHEAVAERLPGGHTVDCVFLDRNLETLLDAACDTLGLPAQSRQAAVGRKSQIERDRILKKAAWDPRARRQLRARVPALERLAVRVAAHLVERV